MIRNLVVLSLIFFLFSCKTETPQPPIDKKAIVDSTITAFQKTLLEQQIDSVFKKYHFNGSIAIFKGTNFASAYLGNAGNFQEVPNMPKRLGGKEIGTPAGGILSTIQDLHTWNNSLYGGKILKPETLKQFMAKSAERRHAIFGKMGYAYGIMLNIGKPNSYFHSGYVKGSPSLNIYYPDTKTSVIILSNIADEEKGKGMTFKPHIEVKKITDHLENTLMQLRSEH